MCASNLMTGTGTVRWRAEGAGLGSQSELSPELMSPPRTRRRRRRFWLAKRADTSYHIPVPVYTATTVHTGRFGIPMTADSIFFSFFDHTGRGADEIQATVL